MEDQTAPVDLGSVSRVRLVDELAETLRGYILDGTLGPGQQLRQVELAERLGVSRTPLREAFRILEHDGFLRIANGNKTVEVVAFSAEDLVHMYEVRSVIDGLAARCCARIGLSPGLMGTLEGCLTAMEAATDPLDVLGYNDAHVRFHSEIATNCGNPRVGDLLFIVRLTSSSSVTRITRKLWDPTGHHPVEDALQRQFGIGNAHHRAIVEAIASRLPEEAERRARLHIDTTIQAIERMAAHEAQSTPNVTAGEPS